MLYSVDGVVYAEVARELAARPLGDWALLTWNGAPFFEHPPLTPWLLAAGIRLLGATTFAVLVPTVLVSVATVFVTYRLGARLVDHQFGLVAATVLALTPEFIRGGRNPMLEPVLMLAVALTVLCHVNALRGERAIRWTLLAGLSFGCAVLAKGPPALLAPATILTLQVAAWGVPGLAAFRLRPSRIALHLSAVVLAGCAVVALTDAWYYHLTGSSFVRHYVAHQLQYTVVEGRGVSENDWTFYARVFVRDWPWWPLILAGPFVAWRTRDSEVVPAVVVGAALSGGAFLGFTLLLHKAEWYVAVHHVGSSLLAGVALRPALPHGRLARAYRPFALGITASVLLLSAVAPSVFLQYKRPFERFVEQASRTLGRRFDGEAIAECIGLDPWKGPYFFASTSGPAAPTATIRARGSHSSIRERRHPDRPTVRCSCSFRTPSSGGLLQTCADRQRLRACTVPATMACT